MTDKFIFQPTPSDQLQAHYDVIIIGSGGTGLTSALQAHELGLKPVILEKMAKIGGNTTKASSGMNAAETMVQLSHHIVDSYEDFYDDVYQGGGQRNNPELLHYFTEHSALAIDWLAAHDIHLDDLTITGGMKVMRTHRPASMAPIGGFLVTELLKQVAQAQLPLFTQAHVTQLLQENGKMSGVQVKIGEQECQVLAPAIILATGGFGAGKELIQKYRPDLAELKTTNQPGALGDGIQLAQAIGAKVVDMDQIQVHPTVQQDGERPYLIGEAVRGEGAILVNKQGQRFVNELDTRKNVTAAINALQENGATLIFDQGIRQRVKAIEFYDQIGLVKTGQSLKDLAEQNGFDAEVFQQTIKTWNQSVQDHQDSQFSRQTGMERSIQSAPYYSIHIAPAVHYTMGGIAINAQTQVLNQQQKVIAGLFAAGEVAGGLHGNNRIGGNSIAETIIFGRQAGQQAFKYIQKGAY
ncbi:flavocytochrome c [Bombilactobacillus bombi]|uniref:flavocytochrome c n=1 Tax=Bombilactobacillus bombi TaxID=1303590 RepID=UPI0015E59E6A|nr:flavocytochrome c [Bombilactobacillus bombi]MBA1434030.1 flavocytochrome c [Bombilactobacillus bombi]